MFHELAWHTIPDVVPFADRNTGVRRHYMSPAVQLEKECSSQVVLVSPAERVAAKERTSGAKTVCAPLK